MECDCYNVLSARGSALFPPLVMQRCMMQMDPAEWQMGCAGAESSHSY